MKKVLTYIAGLLADRTGAPSAKRHACVLFVLTAIALAFLGYGAELVAVFLAAALGENIATIFERGKR